MADDFDHQRFTVEDVGRSNSPISPPQYSAPLPPPATSASGGCFRGCLIGCGVIAIIVVAVALIAAYFLPKFFSVSPAEGARRLKAEVGIDVPDGYLVAGAVTIPGINMFAIMPQEADGDDKKKSADASMFFLMSAPSLNPEQLNEQMKAHRQRQGIDPGDEKEEIVEMKIGAKTLTVRKTTSKSKNGQEIVQYSSLVRPGILLWGVSSPKRFDHKAFETMITSILSVPAKEVPKEQAKKAG